MGLLKNIGYTLLAILVISILVGLFLLVVSVGAFLVAAAFIVGVIWFVAWIIKSVFESK